jgi:uncharacterized hydrophobic protein (TIGR00271 family)
MLKLEVYGEPAAMERVADALSNLGGVRHVAISPTRRGDSSRVSADLPIEAGDEALKVIDSLGVPTADVVLVDLDRLGVTADVEEPLVLLWADVLAQARERAHVRGRYVVLMAAAGVVGAFALIDNSSVLVVGAMAISPDLLPITAACTGLVLLDWKLAGRGIVALAAGLAVAGLIAGLLTWTLNLTGLLADEFVPRMLPSFQTHVGVSTIGVALAAGVAGMLAVEMHGSAAVGVAISVTTLPAAAFIGVAIGSGQTDRLLAALAVLGVNVTMMLSSGAIALAMQRRFSS